jgi:DNA repair protein RadC
MEAQEKNSGGIAMEAQVVRIQMVRERAVQYESPINSPPECCQIFKEIFDGADREMFVVACLDQGNRINAINVVSVGTLTNSLVHPREVFKPAILSNSAKVILAHNHPGGDPTPSGDDMIITRQIIEAGKILKIEVLDHLIIGDGSYYSLINDEMGLGLGIFNEPSASVNHKTFPELKGGEREIVKALREADSETINELHGILLALKAAREKKKQARGHK